MRKKQLVCIGYLCVFTLLLPLLPSVFTRAGASGFMACLNGSFTACALPLEGSGDEGKGYAYGSEGNTDNIPTVDGKRAWATKADVMLSTIRNLIRCEEYEPAKEISLEVVAEYPDYSDGWMVLGYCQSLMGEFEESNKAYDKARSLDADTKAVHERMAYNYLRMGSWDKAKECYHLILEENENDIAVIIQLGYLEWKLTNLEMASYYYRKALKIDPHNVEVIEAISKIEEKLGNGKEVKTLLEKAIEAEPDNPKYYKKLAIVLMNERDYTKAMPILQKLVELDPKNPSAYRNLGIALYKLDRKLEAKEEFMKVLALGDSMDGLYGPFVDSLREAGEDQKAIEFIETGIRRGKQQAWLWGKILEDKHHYNSALSKFTEAAKMGEEPWSGYARKQIARQQQLIKRASLIKAQADAE
jgi:tetratricopeptide (TPR) repeat protein